MLLCILSPVLLIFLAGLADAGIGGITEAVAVAVGMSALLILIAAAVFLFVRYGSQNEKFEFLEKEDFETAYGVTGMVKEKKKAYDATFVRSLSLGVTLCVLSPLPLILAAVSGERDVLAVSMTALLLCIVAVGVYLIVRAAMVRSGFEMLLEEGDYTKKEKRQGRFLDAVSSGYWGIVTAGYLFWSFLTNAWATTWVVWPVAGVLYPVIELFAKMISKDKGDL